MSIPIGTLTIEMAANVARLRKDMDAANKTVSGAMGKIQKSAETATRALGAIGVGLSVGAFASWIKGAIDSIDKLTKISSATGIAIEKLSGLDYAAKSSGTSLESLTQASNKLQLGLATNSAALKSVGISAQDPVEALIELADVYAATEGQSNRAAIANTALGKSWQGLAGFLAQGGDSIRELMDEGAALSGVTKQTAKDAEQFNDAIDTLLTRINALALNIAGPLLTAFSNVIDQLNEGTRAAGGFWKAVGLLGTTNPFLSLEENVVKYRKEVEELTEKQKQYDELALIAFGVNEKLATAAQRLAYFEAMLAIETRNAAAAMAEGASGSNAHALAYNAMISSAEDLVEQMEIEFSLIGLTNEERAVSIAMRKLEEIGIKNGTEAYEKYLGQILDIQKRIGIKKEQVRLSDESAKNAKRESEEYVRLVKSFQDQISKMEIENKTYFDGNAARERAIFLRDTENLKIEDRNRLLAQYDEAAAIKDANEQRKKGIDQQLQLQEDYAKQMEKINDQIGQSLTDSLMQGGKNAKEYLIDLFRTLILRPLLQPIISSAVGTLGFGAVGQALAGGKEGEGSMGQSSGLMNIATGLKSAYDAISGGFAAIGSSASSLAGSLLGAKDAAAAFMAGSGKASMAALNNLQSINSMASTIGVAAQYAAGIGAGIGLGQMISGGYKVGGSSFLATGGGSVIGAILGGPIGGVIGGVVGGLVNRAFGMGKKKVTRSGLELRPTINGTEALGFVNTTQKGGWFRSDKKRREIIGLDQKVTDSFDQTARSISASVAAMTKSLGVSIDDIKSFESSMMIVDTLGKTEEEIQARIEDVFNTFSDSLTGFLIPSIGEFAKTSKEPATTILTRLFSSVTTVNQSFKVLGYTLYEMTLHGAAASQKMVDLFGGIESFTQSTAFYYENFYSAQEKVKFQTEQLTSIMETLGFSLPGTNAAFRQLVDAARATGDDALFATLVQLAPAFNALQVAMAQAAEGAKKTTDELILGLQKINDKYVKATNLAFEKLKNALQKQLDETIALEQQKLDQSLALIELQREAATIARDVALESISAIKDVFGVLTSEIDSLSDVTAENSAQARQFITSALITAKSTGYLPAADDLSRAIKQARSGMGEESFGSSFEMRKDRLRFQSELIALRDISGMQLTEAERQLQLQEQTFESLTKQAEDAQAFYETQLSLAGESFNAQLTVAQNQLDALRGIDNSVLSLSVAMTNFASAISAEMRAISLLNSTTEANANSSRVDLIFDLYDKILNRTPDPEGFKYWMQSADEAQVIVDSFKSSPEKNRTQEITGIYQDVLKRAPDVAGLKYWLSSGETVESIRRNIMLSEEAKSVRGFANGGYYSGGLAMVGEQGPELINFNRPGQVYTANQTAEITSGNGLAAEIQGLRDDLRAQSRATAQIQIRTAKVLERWDGAGLPESRVEA